LFLKDTRCASYCFVFAHRQGSLLPAWAHALFAPPFRRRFVQRSASAFERAGLWLSPGFSGVIIVEAIKQVYAVSASRRNRDLVTRLKPQILPVPALEIHEE